MGDPARAPEIGKDDVSEDEQLTPEEWDVAWEAEVGRRAEDVRSGKEKGVSHEDVMATLDAKLAEIARRRADAA